MDNYTGMPNGHPPQANGDPSPASRPRERRAPTVTEALPYTPFSSILPFSPGTSIFSIHFTLHDITLAGHVLVIL
jgi:hypothetical protein